MGKGGGVGKVQFFTLGTGPGGGGSVLVLCQSLPALLGVASRPARNSDK